MTPQLPGAESRRGLQAAGYPMGSGRTATQRLKIATPASKIATVNSDTATRQLKTATKVPADIECRGPAGNPAGHKWSVFS
ncbi:hypothetical protein [Alkalicoccus urumqiensis]|uniref:Uncharacterized protein n=1 Tax=Alkalicoccus urumqiensis TaxID=1548213 RepID=A0A2P6MJT7_ALKUR|nr:hypothetical protein [Alkalicoccus urumqiensis]PRO66552.1 hypothetical protein C6I21_04200 [Alkalicoccus urumqiensis]